MPDSMRRAYLRSVGVVTATALTGCFGRGGGGGDEGTTCEGASGDTDELRDPHQVIYNWLAETEVAGAEGNYEGLEDWRGRDAVTVRVGVSGNGGSFANAPPAVAISVGTPVEWVWTDDGGLHNVIARPGEQLGESDYTFRPGDPREGSGVRYSRTMDEDGVVLSHCDQHLAQGMEGSITVE